MHITMEHKHVDGFRGYVLYKILRGCGWDMEYITIRVFGNFYKAKQFAFDLCACGEGEYCLVEYK